VSPGRQFGTAARNVGGSAGVPSSRSSLKANPPTRSSSSDRLGPNGLRRAYRTPSVGSAWRRLPAGVLPNRGS
jgi:hypothetical protein